MADNIAITAGAGTTVATDDVSAVHYQRVKLVDGTLDSTAAIAGDVTNGLDVDVTRVKPDGTNTLPSGDTVGRAIFVKPTDGTTVPDVTTVGSDGQSNTSNRLNVSSRINLYNGSTWDRMAGNTSGAYVQGNIAHDGVDAGNPQLNGHRAIAHGTNPTAVAAADRTVAYANRAGIPFVIGGHPNVLTLKHTTITTAVTDAAIITAGAGVKIVVTRISLTLDNASTVFPTVLIGFGPTNTPTTTGVLVSHGGFPAGGGMTIGDGSGILGVGADNDDLRITTTGNATGNGLQVCVSYYTIES